MDRSVRIDPEEVEEDVSPGSLAASTPAAPHEYGEDEPPDDRVEPEGHPKRDVGKGSLRFEHLSEDHNVD